MIFNPILVYPKYTASTTPADFVNSTFGVEKYLESQKIKNDSVVFSVSNDIGTVKFRVRINLENNTSDLIYLTPDENIQDTNKIISDSIDVFLDDAVSLKIDVNTGLKYVSTKNPDGTWSTYLNNASEGESFEVNYDTKIFTYTRPTADLGNELDTYEFKITAINHDGTVEEQTILNNNPVVSVPEKQLSNSNFTFVPGQTTATVQIGDVYFTVDSSCNILSVNGDTSINSLDNISANSNRNCIIISKITIEKLDEENLLIRYKYNYNKKSELVSNILNEATRMSRAINKMVNAFNSNDNFIEFESGKKLSVHNTDLILNGFVISNFKYNVYTKTLTFILSKGTAIIDSTIIELDHNISCKLENIEFPEKDNDSVNKGLIIVYLTFKYSNENHLNRPVPEVRNWEQMPVWPKNQFDFNPAMVRAAFFNPDTGEFFKDENGNSDGWEYDDHVCIISSKIHFEELNDEYDVWINDTSRNGLTTINFSDGKDLSYQDQAGGFADLILRIDGGIIKDMFTPNILGYRSLLDIAASEEKNGYEFSIEPVENPDQLLVFYNGILCSNKITGSGNNTVPDYTIENNTKIILHNSLIYIPATFLDGTVDTLSPPKISETLQVIENITENSHGYLKIIYQDFISVDNTNFSTKTVTIIGINPNNNYLIFYNGIKYSLNIDYIISENTIKFFDNSVQLVDGLLTVVQVVEGNTTAFEKPYVQIIYDNVTGSGSKMQVIPGVLEDRSYLVFYNGLLYRRVTDYSVSTDVIIFNEIYPVAGCPITVIEVGRPKTAEEEAIGE